MMRSAMAMGLLLLLGTTMPMLVKGQTCGSLSDACGPFIAEAAEGNSHNKYLEFANPTDADIALDGYAFPNTANAPDTVGEYEYWNEFDGGATIPSNGLYVVCHPQADDAIKAFCDQEFRFLSNGDDGFCLVQGTESDYTLVDCVGNWNGDPGSGWDVCGQGSTKDGTIVRNCDVTVGNPDWVASSTEATCEWTRYGQNHWDFGGFFECCAGSCDATDLAPCPGDVVGDGVVDVNDLLQLLSDFGSAGDSASDINSDSVVDVNDLLGLLSAFGSECAAGGGGGAAAPCAYGEDCGGQEFTECGTMCPATCGQMPGMMCNEMCYNGFQCGDGQFWDEEANGDGSGACVAQDDCSVPMPELPPGIAPGRPFLSAKAAPMFSRAIEQAVSDWVGMVGPDGKHNHDGRPGGDYGQEEEL